jgi:hypothetical protein
MLETQNDHGAAIQRLAKEGKAPRGKANGADQAAPEDEKPSRGFDAGDLMDMDLPDPTYVCRPWIAEGVTLLCGPPKIGKTTMLRQLIHAANNEGAFFGALCAAADVLFLSLEEGERIMRRKLRAMGIKSAAMRGVRIEFAWKQAADGVQLLREWLYARTGKRIPMIVIDSLTRFRLPPSDRGHAFTEDYNAAKLLADLCKEFPGLCIVILHHTRKSLSDDPVAAISGTYGLSAAADSYLILLRQGGDFRLHAGGRLWEGDASDFAVLRTNGGWQIGGEWDEDVAGLTAKQREVIRQLEAGAKTNKTLGEATKQSSANVSHMLAALQSRGLVASCANGWELVR